MSGSEDEYESCSPSPPPTKKRTSRAAANKSTPGGGILSNVVSFVSREITDFLVTATGGDETSTSQSQGGSLREKSLSRPRKTEKKHKKHSIPSLAQTENRASKCNKKHAQDYDSPPEDVVEYGDDDDDVDREEAEASDCENSPILPLSSPPHPQHRRSLSISMPGSLFPRSPTPEDYAHARRVRFASDVISPVPRFKGTINLASSSHSVQQDAEIEQPEEEDESEDEGEADEPQQEQDDQRRTNVHKEQENECVGDAQCNPSLLIQLSHDHCINRSYQPTLSQHRHRYSLIAGPSSLSLSESPRFSCSKSVRDVVTTIDATSPSGSATPSWRAKEKAVDQDDGRRMLWPTVEGKGKGKEPVRPRPSSESRLPSNVGSGEGARGVDAFLHHAMADTDDVNDGLSGEKGSTLEEDLTQRRIRELEERIRSLEDELARRPTLSRDFNILPPPPPPPPPLPSGLARIPLTSTNNDLSSVRGKLKTMAAPQPPKGIPTNRLPTVPADKMAAFLKELKDVKLRKVGSADSLNRSGSNSSSSQEQSQLSNTGGSLLKDLSLVGYKRKRVDSGQEIQGSLVSSIKRRFIDASLTLNSSASTSGSVSSSSSNPVPRSFIPPPHPSNIPRLRNARVALNVPCDVTGTTPSLCSDNDNEIEDRGPSTPPLLHSSQTSVPTSHAIPELPPKENIMPSIVDRTASQSTVLTFTSTTGGTRQPSLTTLPLPQTEGPINDAFSRRPPSSPPVHPQTPKRPRPPGRVRSAKKATPLKSRSEISPSVVGPTELDPLALSFSPPDESTPVLDPVGRRGKKEQIARKERRLTLEEEIRNASPSYSDEERAVTGVGHPPQDSYSDEEQAINALESGVLVGVGRRSKRLGFLAHGGGGGSPVFMGVGNVEGVISEEQADAEIEMNMKPKQAKRRRKAKR